MGPWRGQTVGGYAGMDEIPLVNYRPGDYARVTVGKCHSLSRFEKEALTPRAKIKEGGGTNLRAANKNASALSEGDL